MQGCAEYQLYDPSKAKGPGTLFISFSIVFPLSVVLFYYCWLRIRGSEQAAGVPPDRDIPLREILGSLPPVPE